MLVSELKLTILMSAEDYSPPQMASGEHILKFTTRGGEFAILSSWEYMSKTNNAPSRRRQLPGHDGGDSDDCPLIQNAGLGLRPYSFTP